jgi:hypothetical protein
VGVARWIVKTAVRLDLDDDDGDQAAIDTRFQPAPEQTGGRLHDWTGQQALEFGHSVRWRSSALKE